MAYNAGTAFLQVVPSFAGVVTAIDAQATEWGTQAGASFKAAFQSQVQDLKIGIDVTGTPLAEAEIAAVSADRNVEIRPTIGAAASAAYLAELAALLGLSAAMAGGAGAAGAGGGLLSGLLGAAGWGGGIAGMAAFGSILSLMGFGFEHLAATVVGLAGSLGGALVGALALAGGALSIFAVGFITDLGGIGQAAGDIKTVYTALSTYQTMAQALAMQIPQSAAAQTALNTALAGFAPAAQSAVLAAALTASQFHWMYDQVTGVGEAIGAQIIQQAMQVGEEFLPTLGRYLTQNMGIIQSALQPIFQFLGTTGLAVFTDLEDLFTSRLPTALYALDQGLQVFVNIIGYLANQTTGGFMNSIANFFAYLNTPAGMVKMEIELHKLIGMFTDWWDLLKQIVITIYDVFFQSAGLGTSIVTTLTSMLKSLDAWITTTSGGAELHNIFTVHKTEVIELLGFLGTLLSYGGQIMIVLIPPFVSLANVILRVVNAILHVPVLGPFLAWATVASLLVARLQLIALVTNLIVAPSAIVAIWNMVAALYAWAAAWVALRVQAIIGWLAVMGPTVLVVAAIAAVVAVFAFAAYMIVTHWQQVVAFFKALPGMILAALGDVGNFLYNTGKAIIQGLINGIEAMIANVVKTLEGVVHTIQQIPVIGKLIGSPSPYFTQVGQAIGQGLIAGMLQQQGAVTAAGHKMVSGLTGSAGIMTSSQIMASVSGAVDLNSGSSSVLAALNRIETAVTQVAPAVSTKVGTQLINVFQQQTRTALRVARAGG